MLFNAVDWGAVILNDLNVKTRYADESNILFMDIHPPKTFMVSICRDGSIFSTHTQLMGSCWQCPERVLRNSLAKLQAHGDCFF